MTKPRLEVADIFRQYGEDYRNTHAATMTPGQFNVMRAIENCRTTALGGHLYKCDDEDCAHELIAYNSCRNRHCPKCQTLVKARWLEARRAELLPVEYFHHVFTIPDNQLAPIALQNKRVFYNLLFRTVAQTLLEIARDPKHLGADIGFIAVLHTWAQNLMHHPHIHCLVPGGGLSTDEKRWISSRPNFFLPVKVLSRYFRKIFLQALQKAFDKGQLQFHGSIKHLADQQAFERLLNTCRKKEWGVYAKQPFAGPQTVLDYLGRYTQRIAISNHRLVDMQNGTVTFKWKDNKQGGVQKTMTLDAEEFIRRFLLHILPEGFMRVRHYGLFANCQRTEKLKLCRKLLHFSEQNTASLDAPAVKEMDWPDLMLALTGNDPLLCPKCRRGCLKPIQILPPLPSASHNKAPPGV
jgi:hypothetical protein